MMETSVSQAFSNDSSSIAISVSGAHKYYGSLHVLNNLDMTVPYGCIYGLLGSSGCGKTTLLRCILGRLQLAEGNITVLGKPPGSRGHQIPGRDVGYMPQESALYKDFTMFETMHYFGILQGLSYKEIKERTKFMIELLELPCVTDKKVKNLSGGQQRRVSLAVAMLQEPPLLILDEPTVGVDPLLRAKIWQHLLALVRTTKITVVITTHYIEEARQAHMVGLMRDGRLLAQSPPDDLMASHNMNSLEEVFLQLCTISEEDTVTDVSNGGGKETLSRKGYSLVDGTEPPNEKKLVKIKRRFNALSRDIKGSLCQSTCNCMSFLFMFQNMLALVWKNSIQIMRNPALLFYQFLIPTFQVTLVYFAIGGDLKGINIAIANHDIGLGRYNEFCDVDNFGLSFSSKLSPDTFNIKYFSSTYEAVDHVKKGKAWAAISIPVDFSISIIDQRAYFDGNISSLVNESIIDIHEDLTNSLLTFTMHQKFDEALKSFQDEIVAECTNITLPNYTPPLKYHHPPVYGKPDSPYTDYVVPGMMIGAIFIFSIGLTALQLVTERKSGLIDRTWVAGVGVVEVIVAQLVTQFFIIVVQLLIMIPIVLFAFKINVVHKWKALLMGCLALTQGFAGMSLGLFVSSIFSEEVIVFQVLGGLYFPLLLMSGTIWPLLGMPRFIRFISLGFPNTYAVNAMRHIAHRGWGLDHIEVLNGFISSFVWMLIFLCFTIIGMKLKK